MKTELVRKDGELRVLGTNEAMRLLLNKGMQVTEKPACDGELIKQLLETVDVVLAR